MTTDRWVVGEEGAAYVGGEGRRPGGCTGRGSVGF